MSGLAGIAAISVAWMAAIYRGAVLLRRSRTPEGWSLWLAVVALSIAATLFQPDVYQAFDRLVGIPNLAEYVGHSFILLAAWQAHAMLLFLVHSLDEAKRKVLLNGVAVAALLIVVGVLFALAPVDVESTEFTTVYADAPFIGGYWLTYLVGINYLLADMVRLVIRYARLCGSDWLRLGLQLVAAGGSFGIAYWCHWAAYLLLRRADIEVPLALAVSGSIAAPVAVILVVVGSVLPALGPRTHWPTPRAWREDNKTYRKLFPLWSALTGVTPEIVLHQRQRGNLVDALQVRHLSYRLYRRVVEILDSLLVLQPDRDPNDEQHVQREVAHAGPGSRLNPEALAEAWRIKAALERHRRSGPADRQSVRVPGTPYPERSRLATEVAWLVQVAEAYATIHASAERPARRRRPDPLETSTATSADSPEHREAS
jgi:hypothetical protein